MAKPSVERAPKFELSNVDYEKIGKYINKYDATDEKVHYLHWSLLKWRVPQALIKK